MGIIDSLTFEPKQRGVGGAGIEGSWQVEGDDGENGAVWAEPRVDWGTCTISLACLVVLLCRGRHVENKTVWVQPKID